MICQLCKKELREEDCITAESNVCPLENPCARPIDEAAWPFPEQDDDDGDQQAEPDRPVAPASV